MRQEFRRRRAVESWRRDGHRSEASGVTGRIRTCPGRGGARAKRALRAEQLDAAEAAFTTDRTALDVDPGDTEQEGGRGFRRRSGRREGLAEDLAAAREFGLAGAVREEAEVANADKAVGEDMEQEAANELGGRQGHDLHAVAVGIVLPAEAHDPVLEVEEALVGEGDAVGIAPEVLEDLLRAGEGRLGIDDPVVLAERGQPRREHAGGRERVGEEELAGGGGAGEGFEVFAAEDQREGADREEETGSSSSGNPVGAVGSQRAPCDDAVQGDVLTPTVTIPTARR